MPLENNEYEDDASNVGQRNDSEKRVEISPQAPLDTRPPSPPQLVPIEDNSSRWRDNLKLGVEVAGLLLLFAYTVFSCLQWLQIRWTNNLTREALNGSDKTLQQTLLKLQGQIDATHTLAGYVKVQADKAAIMAINSGVQATASQNAAGAAKRAAAIADQTLHISERAYLTMGIPIDDFQHGRINIPILNSGHIPSGTVKLIIHEATYVVANPSAKIVSLTDIIEKHWKVANYQTVPIGNLFSAEVHLPAVVSDQILSGKQGVSIVAVMTYNDGFPKTQEQTWIFCDQSSYVVNTKLFSMRPCDDSNSALQILTKLDGYPSAQYEEQ